MRKIIILFSMILAGIALCEPAKKDGWRHVLMGQAKWEGVKGVLDKGRPVEFKKEGVTLAVTNKWPDGVKADVKIDTNTWEKVKRTVDGYFPWYFKKEKVSICVTNGMDTLVVRPYMPAPGGQRKIKKKEPTPYIGQSL